MMSKVVCQEPCVTVHAFVKLVSNRLLKVTMQRGLSRRRNIRQDQRFNDYNYRTVTWWSFPVTPSTKTCQAGVDQLVWWTQHSRIVDRLAFVGKDVLWTAILVTYEELLSCWGCTYSSEAADRIDPVGHRMLQ